MRLSAEVDFARKGQWLSGSGPNRRQISRTRAVFVATSGVLLVCSVPMTAQTSDQGTVSPQLASQAQICDTQNQRDPKELSLTEPPLRMAVEKTSVSEEPRAASDTSYEMKEHLSLRELDKPASTAEPQDPLCKPPASKNASERPADPAERVNMDVSGPLTKAPSVSLLNGELTVDPADAPLRDVIKAIQIQTGIAVEFPTRNMDDRVFGVIGPAPLRDVLTQLLYGSGLNYIIQTSANDPSEVKKLVLSAQAPGTSVHSIEALNSVPAEQKEENLLYGSAGFSSEGTVETIHPIPPAPLPTPVNNVPGIPAGFNLQQAAAEAHKTTGQILDEMQKRQQELLDAQTPPQQ